jgi:hypothetical protein
MSAHPPSKNSRREMRKALIRLRLEMHRQEIRHEARSLVNPLTRFKGASRSVQEGLGIKHGPLWGMGAVMLMGFLTGKGAGGSRATVPAATVAGGGRVSRLLRLSTTLMPLIKLVMKSNGRG